MNRRRFIAAGAAALAASANKRRLQAQDFSKDFPIHCPPPAPPGTSKPVTLINRSQVPRKSAFDLSTTEVQQLRDAYAALRQLTATDPRDPRGWHHQANVHCFYCSGGYDGLGTE